MYDMLKNIIISDIDENQISNYKIRGLDTENIKNNIHQIIKIIYNEKLLQSIIKDTRNVWLIRKRLGFLDNGKVQNYNEIYESRIDNNESFKYYSVESSQSIEEACYKLRKYFCEKIKLINKYYIEKREMDTFHMYKLEILKHINKNSPITILDLSNQIIERLNRNNINTIEKLFAYDDYSGLVCVGVGRSNKIKESIKQLYYKYQNNEIDVNNHNIIDLDDTNVININKEDLLIFKQLIKENNRLKNENIRLKNENQNLKNQLNEIYEKKQENVVVLSKNI